MQFSTLVILGELAAIENRTYLSENISLKTMVIFEFFMRNSVILIMKFLFRVIDSQRKYYKEKL